MERLSGRIQLFDPRHRSQDDARWGSFLHHLPSSRKDVESSRATRYQAHPTHNAGRCDARPLQSSGHHSRAGPYRLPPHLAWDTSAYGYEHDPCQSNEL